MAVMLPGWAVQALSYLDMNWPTSNEDVLHGWATDFRALASEAGATATQLNEAVSHVQSNNEGPALEAFIDKMRSQRGDIHSLEEFGRACDVAAGACDICAGIVVAMKLAVVVQLGIMAASLASGPGALVARQGVKMAINAAIDQAAAAILGG